MKNMKKILVSLALILGPLTAGAVCQTTGESANVVDGWYDPNPSFTGCFTDITTDDKPIIKVQKQQNIEGDVIDLKIAAGSEKTPWLEECLSKWKTDKRNKVTVTINGRSQEKNVEVFIDGVGSVKAATQILNGETEYDIWSPASSLVKRLVEPYFSPKAYAFEIPSLVKSPMVFLTYAPVYKNIQEKFLSEGKTELDKRLSFNSLLKAYNEEDDENYFVPHDYLYFGFTNPLKSNSGLTALITMAYEYKLATGVKRKQLNKKLKLDDLKNRKLQSFLASLKEENNNTTHDSTGKLATSFAGGLENTDTQIVWVYEHLAMEHIDNLAKSGVKGDNSLKVLYPRFNTITDHPYYVLNHGNSEEEIKAAKAFGEFLMEEDQQRLALKYGFRPGKNDFNESEVRTHFAKYSASGIHYDYKKDGDSNTVAAQEGEIIEALMRLWKNL